MLIRVLLAVDPAAVRRRLVRLTDDPGLQVTAVSIRTQLWERLNHEDFDLVVLGPRDDEPAGTLIRSIRSLPDRPEIVVVRPHEDGEERARLLAAGCLGVLWLGLPDQMLRDALRTFLARRRNDALLTLRADRSDERLGLTDFAAASPAMQRFVTMVRRVVASDSALLVLGETGVGKERVARAIHAESPRAAGPFLAVNCGALSESLLESELFGHEEGAFTGATRAHRGHFEMAHRGTIFLDEIGEMPPHVQVKLLRVLEDRRLLRVGGEQPIRVDVRVMAATNRDLEADVKARRFRSDLYYRLAVVTLTVPALRDRRDDIPVLVRHYLDRFRSALGRPVTGVTDEAMDALTAYDWPGNVRELINVIERAVLLCTEATLDVRDLPESLGAGRRVPASADLTPAGFDAALYELPLSDARTRLETSFERRYLEHLLAATRGRIGETARRAGINPRTLYDLMNRHDLDKAAFKNRVE